MKFKSLLIPTACLAALAFGNLATSSAASKKSASPSPAASPSPSASASPAKAPRAIPFKGTVASADQSAKTFTIAGKDSSRSFMISDKTKITKAGAAATIKDITADEMVRGSYWKQADGTLEAKSVKIGEKTDAEKAASAKKGKKAKAESASDSSATPTPSPSPKKK